MTEAVTEHVEEVVIITDYAADWARFLEVANRKDLARLNRNYPFERSLVVDIDQMPHDLFMQLLGDPDTALEYCQDGIVEGRLFQNWDRDPFNLNIRFSHHPQRLKIRELKASKIGKFVSFEGVVRRVQDVKPSLTIASFQCPCGRRVQVRQNGRELVTPIDQCTCGRKTTSYVLVPDLSKTRDCQTLVIQELPEHVLGSEVPAAIHVIITDDYCGVINAGNHVVITGVLKSFQKKPESKTLDVEFECSWYDILDKEFFTIEISEAEETEILRMSEDPDFWEKLVTSIAPSIFGAEDVKEAVALQLFGGVSGYNSDMTWQRGDVHILLVGDPGIAKSKMMTAILALCPRGLMTSGKGSSTAGLTAAAVSDGDGGWTLDAGAVVLADRGQLLIDEMDKMNPNDRSALHQAMEQQEVPINKAGINTTLKSRCSILAAANPVNGRFEDYDDVAGQFNLPPTLLSRFDLIFVMRDNANASTDMKLAEFILSKTGSTQGVYSSDMIRKYISYAKRMVKPELSAEAGSELAQFYVRLRGLGGAGKPMPITPRQLEGLLRLTQASARSRLSDLASVSDAERAIRIMENCLRHVAFDPETNVFDIDRVVSPMSKMKRDLMVDLKMTIIREGRGEGVFIGKIMEMMTASGYDGRKVERVLEEGHRNGAFIEPRSGFFKVC